MCPLRAEQPIAGARTGLTYAPPDIGMPFDDPQSVWQPYQSDVEATTGGAQERVSTWGGGGGNVAFAGGSGKLWEIWKVVKFYSSNVNAGLGTNNSNYVGHSKVQGHVETGSYPLQAGGQTVPRQVRTVAGRARITLNGAAGTQQEIEFELRLTILGGEQLSVRSPESGFFGVFQRSYALARQVA